MPDIHDLDLRVQALSSAVDFWNKCTLWGLVFAAVAAIWIVVATRLTVAKSKELSVVQARLDNAKSSEKDERIAVLNLRSKEAEAGISAAQAAAAAANLKTADLQLKAASLEVGILKHSDRSSLLVKDRASIFINKLKQFENQKVEVVFCPIGQNNAPALAETGNFALAIKVNLEKAGWIVSPAVYGESRGKSVVVWIRKGASDKTRIAAHTLATALNEAFIDAWIPVDTSDRPRPPQPTIMDQNKAIIPIPPLDADTIMVNVLDHP